MSEEIFGILNPRTISQHVDFLQGFGAVAPPELYHLLKSVREAEMSKVRVTPEFQSVCDNVKVVHLESK